MVEPDERLVDAPDLRDAVPAFADRADAGRRLAQLLESWRGTEAEVAGVLAGGALVGAEVARCLGLPHHAWRVLPDGRCEAAALLADLGGRPVIVVDDGVVGGATMRQAIAGVRACGAGEVVAAAAVAPLDAAEALLEVADRVVVASLGLHGRFSVAAAYRRWTDPTEAQVLDRLVRPPPGEIDNRFVATVLDEVARLLAQQQANPFRVRAYLEAARAIRRLDEPVVTVVERGGREALDALPRIGPGLAGAIEEIVRTGSLSTLRRLEREQGPEARLAVVPGIGPGLAKRIVDQLGLESLADLLRAADDGRLATVPGIGPHRIEVVRQALGHPPPQSRRLEPEPDVKLLLDLDAEYRDKAGRGELLRIAPKRNNPTGEAWLPLLHTTRDGLDFTLLFSNTNLAHQLGRTSDWVVVYWEGEGRQGQRTIVTETAGPLEGRRVVRGREDECARLHGP